MLHVGIDLSLTSPGLVVRTSDDNLFAYFYPNRKKDIDRNILISTSDNTTIFHLQAFSTDLRRVPSLLERYHIIATDLVNTICKHSMHHTATLIRMEGYAFDAKSSSVSKLHELGGIVKYQLYLQKFTVEEIAPTKLKKWFTGHGRATKEDMYMHAIKGCFPELINTFEMQACKGIPNPVQDIVDAYALVESLRLHPIKTV